MGFLKSLVSPAMRPDLEFAAEGFMMVALARVNRPDLDLHEFELRHAHQLLSEGCTKHQALSARWGSAHAIGADLIMYDCAVKVAKDMTDEAGITVEAGENETDLYRSYCLTAAVFTMRGIWEADRKEFNQFLSRNNL